MPANTITLVLAAALMVAAGDAPPVPERPAPAPAGAEDPEPVAAAPGYRRPETVEPGCVGRAVTIPEELQEFAPALATVKFAVLRDGRVTRFEVLHQGVDPRVAAAVRDGLSSCAWRPGADAEGRPMNVWVILTFRFQGD